jgi:hypothetical protein
MTKKEKLENEVNVLPKSYQEKFKRLYARGNMNLSISDIINTMSNKQINHAIYQVENSMKSLKAKCEKMKEILS